jgi:hypothetical protein
LDRIFRIVLTRRSGGAEGAVGFGAEFGEGVAGVEDDAAGDSVLGVRVPEVELRCGREALEEVEEVRHGVLLSSGRLRP